MTAPAPRRKPTVGDLELKLACQKLAVLRFRGALETARFELAEVLERGFRPDDEDVESAVDQVDRVLRPHTGARS